jgi:hypothetical protein
VSFHRKDPRIEEPEHLAFIRELPCCVCGTNVCVDAAHVRMSDARVAKNNPGVGQKPHDRWTVPLCRTHHNEQHLGNELWFWKEKGIDVIFLAMALHDNTGDHLRCEQIIRAQQMEPAR